MLVCRFMSMWEMISFVSGEAIDLGETDNTFFPVFNMMDCRILSNLSNNRKKNCMILDSQDHVEFRVRELTFPDISTGTGYRVLESLAIQAPVYSIKDFIEVSVCENITSRCEHWTNLTFGYNVDRRNATRPVFMDRDNSTIVRHFTHRDSESGELLCRFITPDELGKFLSGETISSQDNGIKFYEITSMDSCGSVSKYIENKNPICLILRPRGSLDFYKNHTVCISKDRICYDYGVSRPSYSLAEFIPVSYTENIMGTGNPRWVDLNSPKPEQRVMKTKLEGWLDRIYG
jgi:hypothetical protein